MQFMQRKWLANLTVLLVTALTTVLAVAAPDANKSPPPPQDVASHPAPLGSPPFIVSNPDGTIIVQKRGAKDGKGLTIPPQVIVPVFSPPRK
jgi:hypothetical protein